MDDARANNEAETQPEPMPSSEQTVTEQPEVKEAAPAEEVPSEPESESLELPEDVKARTAEQFDKLQTQLRDERVRRKEMEDQYKQQYQYQYSQTQTAKPKPLYDESTGYVDIAGLEGVRTSAAQANARAEKAEKNLEKYVQAQQEREAFVVYPELNTKDKGYNQAFSNMVRGIITDSMVNPRDYGGRELTLKEAADTLKGMTDKQVVEAQKVGAEKAVKQLTPKEQASLEAQGRSDRREPSVDYGALRNRTRRGDKEATIARLRNLKSAGN